MDSKTLPVISLILSGIAVIAAVYAIVAAGKFKVWLSIFRNKNEHPENLEQIIGSIAAKIKTLENNQAAAGAQTAQLEELLSHSIQHTGLVRFNSLADEGGNLSFSLALLDAHHSGTVLTSLNGRQQNRIYAKSIVGGGSEVPLSEQEQDAVFAAIKSTAKINSKTDNKKRKQTTS